MFHVKHPRGIWRENNASRVGVARQREGPRRSELSRCAAKRTSVRVERRTRGKAGCRGPSQCRVAVSYTHLAGGAWVTDALPVAVVLTNAATGSEMDAWSVISNMDVNQKIGLGGSALIPRVAFENPEHSYTCLLYTSRCV